MRLGFASGPPGCILVDVPGIRETILFICMICYFGCEQEPRPPAGPQPFEQSAEVLKRDEDVRKCLKALLNGRLEDQRIALGFLDGLSDRVLKANEQQVLSTIEEVINERNQKLTPKLLELSARFGDRGVPAIKRALTGPEPSLRIAAARVLSRMGTKEKIILVTFAGLQAERSPELTNLAIEVIESHWLGGSLAQRLEGLGLLGLLGQRAVGKLREALEDDDAAVRQKALSVLSEMHIHDKKAFEQIIDMRRDSDPLVRMEVLRFLARAVKPDTFWKAVRPALRDADAAVRIEAIRLLGRRPQDSRSIRALVELMHTARDSPTAVASLEALKQMAPKSDFLFRAFRKACHSAHSRVRGAAAGALAIFARDTKKLVRVLTGLLTNKDPVVRAAAAHELSELGREARPARSALKKALGDEDRRVRLAARMALDVIRPKRKG